MTGIEYRMFFNNQPATREQLDRVEEITVEQEVDMAWEARIQIPIRTDDQGKWRDENEPFVRAFSRVRVEIKIADRPFAALIDGPIVGRNSERSSEPNKSMLTLQVHDDSVYLNRQDRISRFDDMLDHEIAEQIFGEAGQIANTDIEETPATGSALAPVVVQRGTAMQILRELAKRHHMHAYVLPGDNPGESVGCFKAFPVEPDGLPALILLGSDRNIETFNLTENSQSPSNVTASTLRITDKAVVTSTSRYRDLELLGEEAAFENESETTEEILPPRQGETVDLDRAATARAGQTSYAFEVEGSVRGGCYPAALLPYRVVTVKLGTTSDSGNGLITKVTHSLTRSQYTQSFSLQRNARSSTSNGDLTNVVGRIF